MAQKETVAARELTYTIVLEEDEAVGGFTVTCPALPGVVTEGDTLEEARAMAADAIEGYLEVLQEDGLPIPVERRSATEPVGETVTVRLKAA